LPKNRVPTFRRALCLVAVTLGFALLWRTLPAQFAAKPSSNTVASAPHLPRVPSNNGFSAAPAGAAANPPVAIRGVVRTVGGRPIANASVCASDQVANCCSPALCLVTDPEGRFVFWRGDSASFLLASAPGFESTRTALPRAGDPRTEVSIVLAASDAAGIAGRVVDATGGLVAGALVVARGQGEDESARATAISASDGTFRLNVPAGPSELSAAAEAYSRTVRRIEAPARDVTLVLVPGSSVSGRITAEGTGAPIASARIAAINLSGALLPGVETQSEADGSYRITQLPAGEYTLWARAEGFQDRRSHVALALNDAAESSLTLTRAATLQASVSVAGRPCAGASLLLDGPSAASGVAGPDGTLRIANAAPGRYRAEVRCANALPYVGEVELGQAPVTRHFELDAGLTLRGLVLRANGQPFPGAPVLAMPVSAAAEPSTGAVDEAASSNECVADANGAFACGGLHAGVYDVSIEGPEQERCPAVRVALRAGAAANVVLRAHESGTIRVSVLGAAGAAPIVLAVAEGGDRESAVLRAAPREGRFVFENVRLGRYRVELGSSASASSRVALEHDTQVLDVDLRAPELCSIAGSVVDEAGVSVPDAWVRAVSDDDFTHAREAGSDPTLTDADGNFTLSGLFEGKYRLSVSSAQGEATLADVRGGTRALVVHLPNRLGPERTARPEQETERNSTKEQDP
jgi:hypothetical protein